MQDTKQATFILHWLQKSHYKTVYAGLCGNLNGDWTDDLTHADGTVTTPLSQFWDPWWFGDMLGQDREPGTFVESWR